MDELDSEFGNLDFKSKMGFFKYLQLSLKKV